MDVTPNLEMVNIKQIVPGCHNLCTVIELYSSAYAKVQFCMLVINQFNATFLTFLHVI